MSELKVKVKQKTSSKKKKKAAATPAFGEDDGDGWIVTFSDMMSLLLCFFILLFSMSVVDANKYNAAIKSLKAALTSEEEVEDLPSIKSESRQEMTDTFAVAMSEMEKIAEKMNMFIEDQHIKSQVKVVIDERGVVIKIDAKVMYAVGDAEILPESFKLLGSIAQLLHQNTYKVRVEGHTDNLPIRSDKFPSNWELSSSRATSVVRFFINEGIDPKRLRAEGLSYYWPQDTNDTEEGRAKNRRVEIVFRKEDIIEDVLNKQATDKSEQERLKQEALEKLNEAMKE